MSLIHLFRRCNQRCVFCSYPEDGGSKEETGLGAWLKEISGMPPGPVQISGGEPLLAEFSDLVKLIVFCGRSGRRVELQTNGAMIPKLEPFRLELLVKAVKAARGTFNFNFSAGNAALDRRITRSPGAFAARTLAVKKVILLGAEARLTYVISSLNYKNTARFVSFAAKNFKGLSRLQFSFIKGSGRGRSPDLIPEYAAAAPRLVKALDLCDEKGLKCDVDHIPPCFLGKHYAKCVDMVKMRAGAKGPHLEEKRNVKECGNCGFLKECPGPRKDYIAVHGALSGRMKKIPARGA